MARPAIKNAVRTPSGQISRSKESYERGIKPAEWARIRDEAIARARNHHLGSELGRLLFHDRIALVEFEAGRRYAETTQKCLRTIGLRCMEPGDASRASGRAFPAPDSAEWRMLTEDGQKAAQTLSAMNAALTSDQRRAVEHVCVAGRTPDSIEQFNRLRDGLRSLHVYFAKPKRR